MTDERTRPTLLWWRSLAALGAFNVGLWLVVWATVRPANTYVAWHLALSGVYAVVCAYRAILPRIDLERRVLLDHPLSSIGAGRAAATVAEVCFAAQVALALHELGGVAGLSWVQGASPVVVVALASAQGFCWASVVTLDHGGHAIEESIWAATFAWVAVCLAAVASQVDGALRWSAVVGGLGCVGYVLFMLRVDVPMYVQRWREGRAAGVQRLGVREGFVDAWTRRVQDRSWRSWRPEVAWLTGYFSLAVWTSLAMAAFPRG